MERFEGTDQRHPGDATVSCEMAWEKALKKIKWWKAPGLDEIQAFLWKNMRGLAKELKGLFRRVWL